MQWNIFVSYYDYYQPEAYVPSTDTYIAKDSAINEEIDKLRLSATAALTERSDVIIVSSVSCIYGLGSPVDYQNMMVSLRPGMERDRDDVIRQLIDIQYMRNDMDFHRGTFRVRGDVLEIFPANNTDTAVRVEFFGDEIDRITEIDVLTGEIKSRLDLCDSFRLLIMLFLRKKSMRPRKKSKKRWKSVCVILKVKIN